MDKPALSQFRVYVWICCSFLVVSRPSVEQFTGCSMKGPGPELQSAQGRLPAKSDAAHELMF